MFRSHHCAFPFGFCYFIQSAGDLPNLDHVVKVWNPTWLLFNAISAGEFAKRLKMKSFNE